MLKKIKKVLLADDDADDREIFQRVLGKQSDIQLVGSVENGREVINYLNNVEHPEELPHLIILDHNMPMMNGTETLGAIKSSSKYSDINVVIYSTYSDHNLREKCQRLGASMVIAKPSSMREYESTIETFLRMLG
jgi:DNA-binding NarL/FixJ family response regulator